MLRLRRPRGFVSDSFLLALAGGSSTALLAQAATAHVPEMLGTWASFGVPGLLIYLLSASMKRETAAVEAYARRVEEVLTQVSTAQAEQSRAQAEQSERLLSTVIGLLPTKPEKGSKNGR